MYTINFPDGTQFENSAFKPLFRAAYSMIRWSVSHGLMPVDHWPEHLSIYQVQDGICWQIGVFIINDFGIYYFKAGSHKKYTELREIW